MSGPRQVEQENYMHYIAGSEESASRSMKSASRSVKTVDNYMNYIGGSSDSEAEEESPDKVEENKEYKQTGKVSGENIVGESQKKNLDKNIRQSPEKKFEIVQSYRS